VFEQHSISHFQRIGFDTHRHDGHTPFSKSWRQTERRALPARGAKRNLQKGWYTTFSREGCVIFVKLNQFAPDDLQPVRLSAESGYWQVLDDGRQQRLLHRFGRTCTTLERWPAGLSVPAHPAGEERLLLAGELSDGDTHHPSGSWLRTPRGDQRTWHALTDSLLLVKTGHLPGAPR
jgi:hypothetical protein